MTISVEAIYEGVVGSGTEQLAEPPESSDSNYLNRKQ
jgi:hypothetical protein